MITKNSRERGSSRDYAYNKVKEQIMNGEIVPGTKMSEKEISEKLNLSRTPVREAFLKLNQEGLLGVTPQVGTNVTKIDLALVEEGRFVRENIEKAIVTLACEELLEDDLLSLETNLTLQEFAIKKSSFKQLYELDDAFHHIIYKGCKKERTWEMVKRMNIQFDRLRLFRLAVNQDWNIVVSQHREIFEAIEKKDAKLAAKKTQEHLRLVNIEKDKLKEAYPTYFTL